MRLSSSIMSGNFWKTKTGYELFKSSEKTQAFQTFLWYEVTYQLPIWG